MAVFTKREPEQKVEKLKTKGVKKPSMWIVYCLLMLVLLAQLMAIVFSTQVVFSLNHSSKGIFGMDYFNPRSSTWSWDSLFDEYNGKYEVSFSIPYIAIQCLLIANIASVIVLPICAFICWKWYREDKFITYSCISMMLASIIVLPFIIIVYINFKALPNLDKSAFEFFQGKDNTPITIIYEHKKDHIQWWVNKPGDNKLHYVVPSNSKAFAFMHISFWLTGLCTLLNLVIGILYGRKLNSLRNNRNKNVRTGDSPADDVPFNEQAPNDPFAKYENNKDKKEE